MEAKVERFKLVCCQEKIWGPGILWLPPRGPLYSGKAQKELKLQEGVIRKNVEE